MPHRCSRAALSLVLALLLGGCASEVIPLDDAPPAAPSLSQPLPFTVAVRVQSFDVKLIKEDGFLEDFAGRLKSSRLFEGVIFPVPVGFESLWEVKLLAREKASEPNSNIWKSALTSILPAYINPFAFALYLESEYTFDLEALLTRKREVVASYPVTGHIRYRYQANANLQALNLQGIQTIVDRTSRKLLAALAADAEHLRAEDRARTGK
jgi:hypothetical protein